MFQDPFSGGSLLNALPDELFREVLWYIFNGDLPLAKFVNPATRFSGLEARTIHPARYLTVSRRWLRAGQPLFFSSVVLRSSAQVAALARTLGEYPICGLYVRRLRLEEGAYCDWLKDVLERTPRVDVLFLSLEIYSASYVDGLCAGLDRLTPGMVVLGDPTSTIVYNDAMGKVANAVGRMVAGSNRLSTFEWRCPRRSKPYGLERTGVFADALAKAPILSVISVSGHGNEDLPTFVCKVLENESVEQVRIVRCSQKMKKRLWKLLSAELKHAERLVFVDSFSPLSVTVPATPKAPRRKLKENLVSPSLPESVIKRIIVLALLSFNMIDEMRFSDGLNETEYPAFDRLCKVLMRVSKFFSATTRFFLVYNIGIDEEPKNKTEEQLFVFRNIALNPSLTCLVRCLHIDVPRAKLGADIINLVCQLRDLETLVMPVYPKDVRPLARQLGSSLRNLDLYLEGGGTGDDAGAFCPFDWAGFENIEVLWLRVGNNVKAATTDEDGDLSLELVQFNKLRTLTVQDYTDIQVYEMMSCWDLRTVKNLRVAGFINAPGQTLPAERFFSSMLSSGNLRTLAAGCCLDGPDPELVACIPVNTVVEEITLCFPQFERRLYVNSLVLEFFKKANLGERFRALEKVFIKSLTKWPCSESEIRRSPWPQCLDRLIETFGIEVINYYQTPWKPRLRIRG